MQKPETKFKEKVMKDLKTLSNTWFFKSQEVSRRGIPDIIACVGGIFCALELKAEDGRIDKLQEYTLKEIQKANGLAFAVRPSQWPEVFAKIKDFDIAIQSLTL